MAAPEVAGRGWTVRVKTVLLALEYAEIKMLILRRTFLKLQENHILPMRAMLLRVARYKKTEKHFYFPSSSSIIFGYCRIKGGVIHY